MSKYVDTYEYLNYDRNENIHSNCNYERGIKIMTDNEKELIKLIRENDNPENALITAAVIILDFLKQHESFEEQAPVCLQVLV